MIKKIPPDSRRRRVNIHTELNGYNRILWRLREDSQFLRSTIQFSFILLCVWIGLEFSLFMKWGQSAGAESFHQRPPGAEGFLPISALMSMKYWIQTGIVNEIHPSGLFIFVAIVALGIFMKKAFCSWLCPVGTFSESLWMMGRKFFGRHLRLPKWLDYPLRSIKYILLLFFVYSISQMDVTALKEFIYSPYNKVADIKMYLFFANISSFALWTLIILVALSIVVKNFWCRYLCPYGALLGFLSVMSPIKVTRKVSTCVDCELCTKVCPSSINVHTAVRVRHDECTSCYACIEVCPVKNTLFMSAGSNGKSIPSWIFGVLLSGVFIAITGMAMITGHWQNGITKQEYVKRFQNIESSLYQHHRGKVPHYDPQD